jgi:hypothetical protein
MEHPPMNIHRAAAETAMSRAALSHYSNNGSFSGLRLMRIVPARRSVQRDR